MFSVDQLKKCCGYAKGFSSNRTGLFTPSGKFFSFVKVPGCQTIKTMGFQLEIYPLLLQSAIDGINRSGSILSVCTDLYIDVFDEYGDYLLRERGNVISIETREKALIFIFNKLDK